MAIKKLSTVSVGSHIKLGGGIYRVVEKYVPGTGQYTRIALRVTASIYQSAVHIGEVSSSFNNEETFLVEVVEIAKPALSLTDTLRSQIQRTHQETTEGYEPSTECAPDEPAPVNIHSAHLSFGAARHLSPEIADAVAREEARKADFRAQVAKQISDKAALGASVAKASASAVRRDLDGYQETVAQELDGLQDAINDVSGELDCLSNAINDVDHHAEHTAGLLEGVQIEQEEHDERISYLERKYQEEETKLSIQSELNTRLAQKKQQQELQEKFNQTTKTTGGNGKMKNLLGGLKSQFGKVEGKFAFAATGGLALRKGISNEFVAFDKETNSITDVSGLTLDFKVPAFKLPTAVGSVKKGDIVLNGADFGYVTRVHDDFLEVIIPEKNVNGSVRPTKNALLNASFYTVVQTIDAAGQGGFNPMLLMAMGDGNKDELVKIMALSGGLGGAQGSAGGIDPMMFALMGDKMDDLLPLLLMQQGGAVEGNGIQSMLPFLLMGDKKDGKSNDLLPLLAMSGGLGGQNGQAGGINPMMLMMMSGDGDIDPMTLMMMSGGFGGAAQGGGLFGGQAPQAPQTPQAPASTDSTDGE